MSTLVCVPIAVDTPEQALADVEHARLAGADLVEFRLDAFFEEASQIDACVKLIADSPLPCIATCRPNWEGGEYEGEENARLALFERLIEAEHAPRYIDVELAAKHTPGIGDRLILSVHDFEGRPDNLTRQLLQLRESSATVHKIAFRARSLRDNLELFEILAHRDRPTIALGMGAYGLMSRVLAPKFGGFLTFASLRPETTTAPGQPTVADLLGLYRFKSITRKTKVFGIVGDPVEHSRSPAMHNAGFERVNFDGVYLPLPVAAGYESLKATLTELLASDSLDLTGLSVTMPHKEDLVRLARDQSWQVDDLAARCGAANTLVRTASGLRVLNTDGPAVVRCLRDAGVNLGDVLVLGAGGMARAVAFALSLAGARVHVYNRTPERARQLAEAVPNASHVESLKDLQPMQAVVQCTPIGMAGGPAPDQSPLPGDAFSDAVIVETVYYPRETPLVRDAAARGLRVIDGLDVLVAQALDQFKLFTGHAAPIDLFRQNALSEPRA
ncbi:MAG: type I 3-dehydroquinate dehydratase [Phycisphaerales bacterium]|jgi:3-dehydroquinate dehydratase/shikimate dehydrogenase